MRIGGKAFRTIWVAEDGWRVGIIDQTRLPHRLETAVLGSAEEAAHAIRSMQVRGAPLIGVAGAYGLCLALRKDASDAAMDEAVAMLAAQRPTAINLSWALDEMRTAVRAIAPGRRVAAAYAKAAALADADVETNRMIGVHGLPLLAAVEIGRASCRERV